MVMYNNQGTGNFTPGTYLNTNTGNAQSTGVTVDFLSNGFKVRSAATNLNTNGQSYIYAAWASNPALISNAI